MNFKAFCAIICAIYLWRITKMRAYFFGNMYLSSIQQGIQAAHTLAEMYTKYVRPDPGQEYFILEHWAREHKTMVLLNAGYGNEIRSLIEFFQTKENPLPWAYFNEELASLDGALTCVGIILPEEFYEAAKELRTITPNSETPFLNKLQTDWERALAARLNNYGLAR
ncbi:MAG: hypothetical protein KGI25_02965 [Thaumarchaeota archaeon]|nr:hypothetical protein [Nitrososphaerota archaeon]